MDKAIVTVFGSSSAKKKGDELYQTALELGRGIARAGWTLCNGGYGGTMEAAARGAVEAGGHTIGVTCTAFSRRAGPNAYIRQEVPTFDLLQRLNTLVCLGRAYVVLPGGTGTLLELALVWERANKRLPPRGRPVVVLGEYWKPVVESVAREQRAGDTLHMAPDVATALDILGQHFGERAVSD